MAPPRDEGPSPEDLRRFGSATAYCPDCRAEIWDQADVCPKCYAYLGGDTARRTRRRRSLLHGPGRTIIVALLVGGFLISIGGLSLLMYVFR
jgi:hypothetical protein